MFAGVWGEKKKKEKQKKENSQQPENLLLIFLLNFFLKRLLPANPAQAAISTLVTLPDPFFFFSPLKIFDAAFPLIQL